MSYTTTHFLHRSHHCNILSNISEIGKRGNVSDGLRSSSIAMLYFDDDDLREHEERLHEEAGPTQNPYDDHLYSRRQGNTSGAGTLFFFFFALCLNNFGKCNLPQIRLIYILTAYVFPWLRIVRINEIPTFRVPEALPSRGSSGGELPNQARQVWARQVWVVVLGEEPEETEGTQVPEALQIAKRIGQAKGIGRLASTSSEGKEGSTKSNIALMRFQQGRNVASRHRGHAGTYGTLLHACATSSPDGENRYSHYRAYKTCVWINAVHLFRVQCFGEVFVVKKCRIFFLSAPLNLYNVTGENTRVHRQ